MARESLIRGASINFNQHNMEVLKMQCNHKDCEENWASDDQWAFDEDGYCIRCKDKTNINMESK
jgi:hypothetical protein